ncbi:DUF2764 family protein [Odoribacter lunatus]|uniref:DUF2764 family protein n=1 Tax=Odoribacter lunatus TaxID=2941335 RepID=UPI002041345B|nr:DUF2764 family protein [Odoribacter lunatus]
MNYVAFIAGLPEIMWDERKLPLTLSDFREQAKIYIKGKDAKLLDLFFLPNDNLQVLRLLNKQEALPDLQTVYSVKLLEEEIQEPTGKLPTYLSQFIFDFKNERLKYDTVPENVLSWMYYDYMLGVGNKLVRRYAEFSMNLKNLVTALNSRKYDRDVRREVIGGNDFAAILRTATSKDFGLVGEYAYVDKVIALMKEDNLVEREKGIDLLIWDFLDEEVVFEYFSIERVISIMLKLMIVERWSKMSTDTGRKVFMEMIQKFRESFQFDEQFK